jgi:hypothetical protein
MVRESTPAVPEDDPPVSDAPSAGYISLPDLDVLLAERDAKHAAELAAMVARVPVAMVAANAGGPGVDQHQQSWSLAEQEAAQRGETLDHWVLRS